MLQIAGPLEAGADGAAIVPQLVAVQRVAHLKAQGVAGGQARGHWCVGHCHEGVPDRRGGFGRTHDLHTRLTGVAGARHQARHSSNSGLGCLHVRKRKRLGRGDWRECLRPRGPLQGKHGDIGRAVDHGHAIGCEAGDALNARGDVGGVDHQQKAVEQCVHQQVVNHPAVVVGQQGVLGLPGADAGDVVGEDRLQELAGTVAHHVDLTHVRHVEESAGGPHGQMLRAHPLVLNRHLPPGERHDLGSGRHVGVKERGPL